MVNPLAWIAIATAVLGLWTLLTGRPLRGFPRWPSGHRSLRTVGACEATASLVVVMLVVTHNDGVAFLTYGLTAVALAAAIQFGGPTHSTS